MTATIKIDDVEVEVAQGGYVFLEAPGTDGVFTEWDALGHTDRLTIAVLLTKLDVIAAELSEAIQRTTALA